MWNALFACYYVCRWKFNSCLHSKRKLTLGGTRFIVKYNKWDSVNELIFYLEHLDYKSLCNIKKFNFRKRLVTSSNLVISNFVKFYLNFKEFFVLACKTELDINMSGSKIKFTVNKRLLNKVFV